MRFLRSIFLLAICTFFINSTIFAQQTGSVTGQITDALGAIVVGATVTAVGIDGKEKTTTSNKQGDWTINGLAPGTYIVRVTAPKFALYENQSVEVTAKDQQVLSVVLTVEGVQEQVQVSNENGVSTDPDSNASATVLKDKDLDALPDDPDELEAALQALAGPSAGPSGGQIYIDGFTGGRLPPKEAIREIRINQNQFSAEYDRLGFGRIEILTKPGSDRWRGQAFLNYNNQNLNSRNPFAANRAPSQTKFYGGSFSGPIQKKKSSFFLDFSNRQVDNNAIVNATIIDPAFNVALLNQEFVVPQRRLSVSPRFDYQINDKNTLIARYEFTSVKTDNQGIGDISLPSRAFQSRNIEHEVRFTETLVVNPKTINETRFQFNHNDRRQTGDNSIPTVNVSTAFTGGGAQIGLSYNLNNSYELQNYTTTTLGKSSQHTLKFGVRLRGVSLKDRSENNFGGNFLFPGVSEILGSPNCDRTAAGCVVSASISPIEQYRQKLLGNANAKYNPTQFTITTGNPLQNISQTDVGVFAADDWRYSPKLTLSFGLRYENQTNIKSNFNLAPRVSFAYSPGAGGARAPKTVIRGGFGIFYDRFSENLSLQAQRFNGTNQLSLLVSANDPDPARRQIALNLLSQPTFTLNGVSNAPTAAQILAVLPQSNTIRRIDSGLQAPYTLQTALGIERQLPNRSTLSLFYIASRNQHLLRTVNVNAPICPLQVNCSSAPRPIPSQGNIYQYESSGILNQNQILINFRSFVSQKFTIFSNYRLNFAKSDTDGTGSFPGYTYDLTKEYGRSSLDTRHNFFFGGSFTMPWKVSLSPFIIATSGRPFNITRGVDTNGDSLFTERPSYAEVNVRCNALGLTESFCGLNGTSDSNAIIPRNYGKGPSYFSANLRVNKTFGFGGAKKSAPAAGQGDAQGSQGGGNRGGGNRGGGGGGMMGGFGGSDSGKPYNLNVGINFNNLFNNVNFGTPIGSLNSSRFGQSTSTAFSFGGGFGGGGGGGVSTTANRRIELQMRFSW